MSCFVLNFPRNIKTFKKFNIPQEYQQAISLRNWLKIINQVFKHF